VLVHYFNMLTTVLVLWYSN